MQKTEHLKYTKVFARTCLAEFDYIQRRRNSMAISNRNVIDEIQRLLAEIDVLDEKGTPTVPTSIRLRPSRRYVRVPQRV